MTAPGWFGKISSLGDFASRRLSADCLQVCDEWLSQCIAESRTQLGTQWLGVYLAAPIWRFAWAPGVLDGRWWFGVLMPSCDSVGRYFPLLVMQPREAAPPDAQALAALDRWQQAVSDAAAGTLDDGSTVEQFETELHEVPGLPRWQATGAPSAWPAARRSLADGDSDDSDGSDGLGAAWQQAALHAAAERWQGRSLWWRSATGPQAGRLLPLPGLPAAEHFPALLQGTG